MKKRFLLFFCSAGFGVLFAADESARPKSRIRPYEHYQVIVDRAPFGPMAGGDLPGTGASTSGQQPGQPAAVEQEALAKQITMSGITIMPDGMLAVGFADASANPPTFHFLRVGEKASATGWMVSAANYKEEWATLEKEGIRVTIQLGKGLIATPPETPLVQTAQAPVSDETAAIHSETTSPTGFGTLIRPSKDGQPRRMTAQIPESAKRMKAELDKVRAEGGDTKSYMERLRERNRIEKEQREAAETAAREQLSKTTESDRAEKERQLNLELIKQGARPISDIRLTEAEEKELVEKGLLSP